MSYLFLVRHGDNDFIRKGILIGKTPGVHLNHQGHLQALAVAKALKKIPFERIYSSPLERCIETAQPLAQILNKEIIISSGLADTNVGEWAGKKISHLRKLPEWKIVQENPSVFRFPGGDSFVELQTRLVGEILSILEHLKSTEKVAIFFHADPIKLVISHLVGLPINQFQRIRVDTGSISIVEWNKKRSSIIAMNWLPENDLDRLFSSGITRGTGVVAK